MDAIELTLPSGLAARVSRGPGEGPVSDDRVEGVRLFGGRFLAAIERDAVRIELGEKKERMLATRARVGKLALRDYHALRDAAFRVGAITTDDSERTCRNCDVPMVPSPDDAPIEDLDRWYVDEDEIGDDIADDGVLEVPLREVGDRSIAVRMRAVTADEAKPFWRAIARRDGIQITPAVVRAMGVVPASGIRDDKGLARLLDELPDELWARVTTAFVLLNYSPRSAFPVACAKCGALHDVEAPPDREAELEPEAYDAIAEGHHDARAPMPDAEAEADAPIGPFPGEDEFAEMALGIGREVYAEMGIANVELEVSFDTPPVDGSGEPLLGSYMPQGELDEAGVESPRFVIHVFYRTFARMFEDEPYDVAEELRETIEHEVEHHLHHLRGHDPMDEEEREEAMRELTRTFGKRAIRRARIRGAVAEAKSIGWLALAVVVALGLAVAFTFFASSP